MALLFHSNLAKQGKKKRQKEKYTYAFGVLKKVAKKILVALPFHLNRVRVSSGYPAP